MRAVQLFRRFRAPVVPAHMLPGGGCPVVRRSWSAGEAVGRAAHGPPGALARTL